MSWFIAAQGHETDPDRNDYLTSKWLVLIRPLVAGFHSPLTTTTAQIFLGTRLSKDDAQKMSDSEVGEHIAFRLRQMDIYAAEAGANASQRCDFPEIREVKITAVTRSNEPPEWYEEGLEEWEQDLSRLSNDHENPES